jgi:peptidoglycan-N-acetylglucosamine deacetylase
MQEKNPFGLSVDIEDWFHILESNKSPHHSEWNSLENRIEKNTLYILNLFDKYNLKATFFILGWVAKQYPELVRDIVYRGHEIGSHGHLHTLVSQMTPEEFAKDLDMSLHAISRATNRDVLMYRAPGFSITPEQFWAFPILASRGIQLDSSLFIGLHAHGGLSLKRHAPFEIILKNGQKIIEVPILSYPILKLLIPFSGGGYFRMLPTFILAKMFKLCERSNFCAVTYLHPRDFDLYQPRLKLGPVRYFKYYIGLRTFPIKFKVIIEDFRFNKLSNFSENIKFDSPVFVDLLNENEVRINEFI